ncbi:LacI family DNA-binding transcriptional regulator [Streptomyces sp. CoH27]|uniref:LacI family DNA-binding transcriptional regulator n=1 Tax=Streptomyces sp. CoH27 TaxID=2875763 RepID=UPI0021E52EC8|nr:LacI family DNA-binding transcriptional regulator [Streptomyces sp. CoH27]
MAAAQAALDGLIRFLRFSFCVLLRRFPWRWGGATTGTDEPVTLQGIAERLGLHVSTVSRVLNGKADVQGRAPSGETAQRIRSLARELGYRPNPHATSLRTRRSNLVGVLFPRLSEIVVATIHEGVEEEAAAHGLSVFVTNTRDDPAVQRERIAMVLGRRVDGLIIGDAHLDGAVPADPVLRRVPYVLVNRRTDGDHPAVTCDDFLGGRMAADTCWDWGTAGSR